VSGPARPAPRRTRVLTGSLVVVLLAVAVAGVLWWRARGEEGLARAVAVAPVDSERLAWVDWAGVRRELGGGVGGEPSPEQLQALLDEAYAADLSATSALVESAPALQRLVGLSPATIGWESLAQSEAGALLTLGAGQVDLAAVADDLERADFERPDSPTGVWDGGVDLAATLGLSPQLSYVALLAEQGLVMTSDDPGYLQDAVAAVLDDGERGMPGVEGVVEGVAGVRGGSEDPGPLAALVLSGANACTALAMAQADDTARAEADVLIDAAGAVSPLTAFAMGLAPGDARVAMSFETEEQARANADSRAALAVGPAPGQGGSFADRFTLDSATAEDGTVVLDLDPAPRSALLSDLGSGPVLYATC
jgi:hypothetical protein